MPRTEITVTTVPGGSTAGVGFKEFSWTAGDASNGNQFTYSGKDRLVIRNVNADSPGTSRKFTLQHPRGKVEYNLAAGAYMTTGLLLSGWKQSDNKVYVDVAHADLQMAILVEQ